MIHGKAKGTAVFSVRFAWYSKVCGDKHSDLVTSAYPEVDRKTDFNPIFSPMVEVGSKSYLTKITYGRAAQIDEDSMTFGQSASSYSPPFCDKNGLPEVYSGLFS